MTAGRSWVFIGAGSKPGARRLLPDIAAESKQTLPPENTAESKFILSPVNWVLRKLTRPSA
jgi:hypothetical protein